MNKVHFKFFNGSELLIDEYIEYDLVDNWYTFEQLGTTFKFYVGEPFQFIKETGADIFKISTGAKPFCTYTLKKENLTFDIGLLDCDYSFSNKELIFKYSLESDVEEEAVIGKTIILSFN